MTICKRGTCFSTVIVSSSVYRCTNCDYTEIVRGDICDDKTCPKCNSKMTVISFQAEEIKEKNKK